MQQVLDNLQHALGQPLSAAAKHATPVIGFIRETKRILFGRHVRDQCLMHYVGQVNRSKAAAKAGHRFDEEDNDTLKDTHTDTQTHTYLLSCLVLFWPPPARKVGLWVRRESMLPGVPVFPQYSSHPEKNGRERIVWRDG